MKAFLAVTHLLGAGHLTRAAAIARAFVSAGHEATLVSGGSPAALIDLSGCRFVQLPPVRSLVGDLATLRDDAGRPVGPDHLRARRDLLLASFAAVEPDVVLTELFPFGRRALAPEFLALVTAVESARPRPALISSIRDILVTPTRSAKVEASHDCVERSYDAVFVHGNEELVPLEASWPVDPRLRRRLTYTGYVGPDWCPVGSPDTSRDGPILVSGGSSAASLPLYRAALRAAPLLPDRHWRVLIGTGVDEAAFQDLAHATPVNVTLQRARADFRDLLSKAAVFVGQAGYNTVMDIIATQARTVLVPFEQGRETEQRLRAEALAARGLVTLLPEAQLDGPSLVRATGETLTRKRPSSAGIRLDGAAVTVLRTEELLLTRNRTLRASDASR